MSLLGWAVVSEFVLILVFIAIVFGFKWRQRRRHHRDIEQLLEDIETRQVLRGQQLSRRLQEHFGLDSEPSSQLSDQLIDAEKQFLQAFIEQQLRQASVSSFYENLCEVLDAYYQTLKAVGKSSHNNPSPIPSAEEQKAELEALLPINDVPDWGDVFD